MLKIYKFLYILFFLILIIFPFKNIFADNTTYAKLEVSIPEIIVGNTFIEITLTNNGQIAYNQPIYINDSLYEMGIIEKRQSKKIDFFVKNTCTSIAIKDYQGKVIFSKKIKPIPLWMSILPPLLAIILAFVFKEVFSSIFLGLYSGSAIIATYIHSSILSGLLYGFLSLYDYLVNALSDSGHASIIIFSILIGGTVNIISQNGSMKSIIARLSRHATDRKSGQLISMIMGIIIFFDDYANTLVVGNTMRPITDKLKISREKLSYIVDSTAAPVVAMAFITTWIGAELSYIKSGLDVVNLNESPYLVFLHSLKYSFYPVFTLVFMFFIIIMRRDFGPMLAAEKKAANTIIQKTSNTTITQNTPISLAIIPILIIIFGTLCGLFYTGYDNAIWNSNQSFLLKISETLGKSDSFKALTWASLLSLIVAIALSLWNKIFSLQKAMEHTLNGFKSMLQAIVILILAWSLASVTMQLHTADFFTEIFLFFDTSPVLLPAITFIIAALISFSTGSSWGTMAILYPIMLPVSWQISTHGGLNYAYSFHIFYGVVAAVITGSVFGDHCSPISDTTILSSMASSCRHIDHVRTQMPYAITVAVVALVIGIIPTSFNIPFWIMYIVGTAVLFVIVKYFGKRV